MITNIRTFLAVTFLLLVASVTGGPAKADLDYRCLQVCTADQPGQGGACVQQCSYEAAPLSTPIPQHEGLQRLYRQFTPPVPFVDTLLQVPPTPLATRPLGPREAPRASLDYQCVNLCMQGGGQSQLCRARCAEIQ